MSGGDPSTGNPKASAETLSDKPAAKLIELSKERHL